ncbi:hypothetical protein LDENG_00204550 [Lucifuga dentata]|nr:hypothetical protein LDENG_00204550 [Lucifuga dentata]
MQAVTADPAPENPGMPLNVGTLRAFAQNMVENIIQPFVNQMEIEEPEVDHRASSPNQDWEMLAEELASAVIEVALKEACRGRAMEEFQHSQEVFQSSSSPPSPYGVRRKDGTGGHAKKLSFSDGSVVVDANINAQTNQTPLSQSGLPVLGSLDYPDAPPPTPLVPEPIWSKDSFIRKLKGGLAKEFLPSPPPPTPKDEWDGIEAPSGELRLDFMEDVMRSLSTGCAEGGEAGWKDDLQKASDSYEGGNHVVGAKMEAFAEALSVDIINRVTSRYASILNTKNMEKTDNNSDICLLAHRLAETIITTSFDEVKMHL